MAREVVLSPLEMDRNGRVIGVLRKVRTGVAFRAANVIDGVMFRFRYSEDGSFTDDDIILENIWHPDFEEIFTLLLERTKDPWLDRALAYLKERKPEIVPQSTTTRALDRANGTTLPPWLLRRYFH